MLGLGFIGKGLKAVATGTTQSSLGIQSPFLPGMIVRLGRFFYAATGVWIGGIWYSAYVNQRTPPPSSPSKGTGPQLILPGTKKAQYPPDRPDRKPGFATAAQSGQGPTPATVGQGVSSVGGIGSLGGAAPGNFQGFNPLPISRTDQGVDFTGTGPVRALSNGKVIFAGLWPGWPGTDGIVYTSPWGNIYVMEHFQRAINPATGRPFAVGDTVQAGMVIGNVLAGYPWEETGFANSAGTGPQTPYNGRPDGTPMPGGLAFRKLLGYN